MAHQQGTIFLLNQVSSRKKGAKFKQKTCCEVVFVQVKNRVRMQR